MHELKLSITRKAMLWWFSFPANPYVSISASIDFAAAEAYLDQLNRNRDERVSVHHLVVAAAGRTIHAFPAANARIVGHRIFQLDDVGVAMPVNLIGHEAGAKQETTIAVVESAESRSLVDIAQLSRRRVADERAGKSTNALMRTMQWIGEHAPYPVIAGTFGLAHRAMRHPLVARQLYRHMPVSTAVSNVGASFAQVLAGGNYPGLQFRAAAIAPPQRLVYAGTVFGISAVQDEVVAKDGQPEVRPMLPVVLTFDHRLIDGVLAGRILVHLSELLADPESVFGADGMRTGPSPSR